MNVIAFDQSKTKSKKPFTNYKRTPKYRWTQLVWHSAEPQPLKMLLLTIGWYMDEDGRDASRSLKQLAEQCSCHKTSVEKLLKKASQNWLDIDSRGGFSTKWGHQNRYHCKFPPDLYLEAIKTVSKECP